MSLYKRSNVWWVKFTHGGQKIQRTTGTSHKQEAQRFHDQFRAELWKVNFLEEKPDRTWKDAVARWLEESSHKKSLVDDKSHLQWLDKHLGHLTLKQITRELLDRLAKLRLSERRTRGKNNQGKPLQPATVNRMLEIVRAILRKAEREWLWMDKAPVIRMLHEDNRRIRWLTHEQVETLLNELPEHLANLVAFSLATGLRQFNVLNLQWPEVDLVRKHAFVHPDEAKAEKAIPIPLNSQAMAILKNQIGKHEQYVFTYRGKPIGQCNTKAWRNALVRAKITNFRWHDLRHTWASWHVQNGTSLQELQQLGAWSTFDTVLRYAHLSSNHLQDAAERVVNDGVATIWLQSTKKEFGECRSTP